MSEEVAKRTLVADNLRAYIVAFLGVHCPDRRSAPAPEETQELLALQPPNSQPVRKLAPELLTIVFENALPADWKTTEPGRQTLNFAQVNHTWRAVAFSSPSLWKRIFWKIPSHHADEPQYEEAIALHLQRSKKASLSVKIVFESQDAAIIRAYLKDNGAWQLLRAEAYRWYSLELFEVPPAFLRHTRRLSVPILQVLCIFVPQPHPDVAREPMLLFRSTPALQHLGISYPFFCNPTHFPHGFPITSLMLRFGHPRYTPSVAACAAILRLCAGTLKELRVVATSEQLDWRSWPTQRIRFPVLKELILASHAIQLCHVMIAPALRSVSLFWLYRLPYPEENLLDLFINMTRQSAGCPNLRHLSLDDLQETPRSVTDCLAQLSSLGHLNFRHVEPQKPGTCTPEDLISILTRRDNDVESLRLLPRLSSIKFWLPSRRDELRAAYKVLRASRSKERMHEGQRLCALKERGLGFHIYVARAFHVPAFYTS
ncbi:hypothetical protein EV715DRAFT_206291 [Schizophyllum commune]